MRSPGRSNASPKGIRELSVDACREVCEEKRGGLLTGHLADGYVAVGKRPYFDSRNFFNVLRWNPIEINVQEEDPVHSGGGEPVLYSV
ncbi:hypothetical protein NHX12_001702, partial [Muraenolepis orangiensis]